MTRKHVLASAILTLLVCARQASAGPNDFFGSSLPGTGAPPGVDAAAQQIPAGAGDYTDDEKRMQKKFKASLTRAKELIAKGDEMMKRAEKRNDDKMYKKGKIFKEIGEKQLAELNANNPFPEVLNARAGKGKGKDAANGP